MKYSDESMDNPKDIPPVDTPEIKEDTPSTTSEKEESTQEKAPEVDVLLQKLDQKTKDLDKTIEALGGFFKGFEKTINSINTRLDKMEDKLPKEISKPKPSVKGYYDWDSKAQDFVNEKAKTDYHHAKETIGILKNLMS